MASFGSVALFHLVGPDPEAARLCDVDHRSADLSRDARRCRALRASYSHRRPGGLWWFSAPQLSLYELPIRALWRRRRFACRLLAADQSADQAGCRSARLYGGSKRRAGRSCRACAFYQSYAREIAEANGWKRLATQTAQARQHSGRYGTVPCLARWRMRDAAVSGKLFMTAATKSSRPPGNGTQSARHALVAQDGFSARYDLDRIAGTFSRPSHKLAGQTYVGKNTDPAHRQGGVASAWMCTRWPHETA